MNRKAIIIISLLFCLLSIQAVCADAIDDADVQDNILAISHADADYGVIDEENIGSSSNDILTEGDVGSFSQLQELIDSDTTGTITLDKNYTFNSGSDSSLTNGIVISKDITIEGNGFTIDALSSARIFNITSGSTIKLTGINFVNGGNESIPVGGSIYTSVQGLTIDNCNFTGSYTAKDGGAVYVKGDYCTVSNSIFTDNVAGDDGGALYWEGNNGIIYNVTCVNNRAVSSGTSHSKGGTISLIGSNISVDMSTFTDSFGTYNGGALFITGNDVNITNCDFKNCTSDSSVSPDDDDLPYGGAIYIIGNNTLIDTCGFEECSATNGGVIYVLGDSATITNSTFTDNDVTKDGGAVYVEGDYCTVANSTFSGNVAGDDGGALYWNGGCGAIYNITCMNNRGISSGTSHSKGGTISLIGSNISVDMSTFTDSFGTYNGGALFITGNDVNITNCDFKNCTSDSSVSPDGDDLPYGGAIYIIGNNTLIDTCGFEECSALNGGVIYVVGNDATINNSTFDNNDAVKDGGALSIEGDYCTVANSTFSDNVAGDDGGAIYWEGDNGHVYNITCENNKGISSGGSNSKGGTICLTGSNVTVDKSSFKDSFSTYNGGALFITGNDVNITNSEFKNCKVDITKEPGSKDQPYGGAVYIIGNNTDVVTCTFDECSAINGGTIYVQGNDALISDSTFNENKASKSGGAIYIVGQKTLVNGSNFTSNKAAAAGAIHIDGPNTHIDYCSLDKNTATGSAGAINVSGDNARLSHVNFTNNVAKSDGGALSIGGQNASVYYSSFDRNDAKANGGAINWIGGHGDDSIVGCLFTNNNCNNTNNGGGAVFWTAGKVISSGGLIKDCVFINNTASGRHGGAVNWFRTLDSKIDNCTFINNTANSDGGALYTGDQNGGSHRLTITNSRFYNNTAKKHGGAIANQMGDSYLYNNTFDGNKANSSGGTILMKEGHADNSIIDTCFIYNSYVHKPINLQFGESGGAIRIGAGDDNITIRNCVIINSTTHSTMGGAISIQAAKCKLENVTIINATSENDQGGAIYWSGNNGRLTNVNITNSSTHTSGSRTDNRNINGGAIYLSGNNAVLTNITITDSYTNSSDPNRDAHGGAIYISGDNSNLNNVSVYNSYAYADDENAYGGAIYLEADKRSNINDATLFNNSAVKGGALYASGSQTNLHNSLLANNTADEGGAAYLYAGSHNIENTSFENNTAEYGGAIYYMNSTSPSNTIKNSNITFNKAFQGSGIYANASELNLENDILLDNQAHSNKFIDKYIKLEDDGNYSIGATFVAYDNQINAMWLDSSNINEFKNVTYWSVNGVTVGDSLPTESDHEIWQNITVERLDENGNVISSTAVPVKTDANGVFKFNAGPDINIKDSFKFYHEEDTYYTYLEDTLSNVTVINVTVDDIRHGQNATFKINLTDGEGNPLTGNVTVTTNITGHEEFVVEVTNGKLSFDISGILPGFYNVTVLFKPNTTYFGSSNWDTFRVTPTVVLNITKTVDKNRVGVEDEVVFTINVTNIGPSNATNVNITDYLPDAFTTSDPCELIVSQLNVGESKVITIHAIANVNGTFTNTAKAYCYENDTVVSDDATVIVNPVVNFTLIKTADPSVLNVTDLVNFTITVINNGPSNATNVEIMDILDSTFEFVSASGNVKPDETNLIVWEIPKIVKGGNVTVWVQIRAKENGTYVNWAHVDSNETHIVVSNKTNITVNPIVDLIIEKTTQDTIVEIGENITYTITVTNKGPSNATNVTVKDNLSSLVEVVYASDDRFDKNDNTWYIGELNVNETVTLTLIVKALDVGIVENSANVTSNENDTNITNNNATSGNVTVVAKSLVNGTDVVVYYQDPITIEVDSVNATNITYKIIDKDNNVVREGTVGPHGPITDLGILPVGEYAVNLTTVVDKFHTVATNQSKLTVLPIIDLAITVTVDKAEAYYGDIVEFIITVVNNGPCDATGVVVKNNFDEGFVYVADNLTDSSYEATKDLLMASGSDEQSYDPSSGVWKIGDLANGESVSLAILERVDYLGTRGVESSVSGNEKETNYTNNNDSAEVTVKPIVDLEITKKVDKTHIKVGDKVTYTITVKNNGPNDATGVKVIDKEITQHKFVSASSKDYNPQTGEWNVGDLANGSTVTLQITVIIEKVGTYGNTVFVYCNETDTNMTNNNASSDKVVVTKDKNPNNNTDNNGTGHHGSVSTMPATGNPIMVLLAVLLVLIFPVLRRFEK